MIRRRRTTGRHDTDPPDHAALEELRRAFGTDDVEVDEDGGVDVVAVRPSGRSLDDTPTAPPDASLPDAAPPDASPPDRSRPDASPADTSPADTSPADTVRSDTVPSDASLPEAAPSAGRDPLLPSAADEVAGAGRDRDDRPSNSVITITDEDLPDPVYIDGDLDPDPHGAGDRSVVFIDDDRTADVIDAPEAVPTRGTARTSMDPKMRDRRIAVARAEGRRRLRWFVVVGGIVAVVVGALAVLGSPLFAVERDQVRVTGAVYSDPVALDAVIEDLVGTPTLIADTRAAERRLEQIAWVAEARVRTRFPASASIEIRERVPLATFQGPDGRFRVIDREGRVLDVIDGQPVAYMLINSADSLDLQAGQFAAPGFAAAAEVVQALTASVRGRVATIDVDADGGDLRMFLDDDLEIRFGAASDLLVKLVRLETVLPIAAERGARVVDVSTSEVTLQQ